MLKLPSNVQCTINITEGDMNLPFLANSLNPNFYEINCIFFANFRHMVNMLLQNFAYQHSVYS